MRINATSNLTAGDVREAIALARSEHGQDIFISELATSPRGAITVYLESENGRRAVNRPQEGYMARGRPRAASWTAWGYFIAELFKRSPKARIGQYRGVDDFRRQCTEYFPHRERYGDSLDFLKLVEGLHA